jgi:hypothetical protein
VSHGTNPDFGDVWRDLLRQREDAGNSPGADAIKAAEFGQATNRITNLSRRRTCSRRPSPNISLR